MAKFICDCGYVMNLSGGRHEAELALISERQIEQIADMLVSGQTLTDEKFFTLIDENRDTVYRCPSCNRLHVEDRHNRNHFQTYVLQKPSSSPIKD